MFPYARELPNLLSALRLFLSPALVLFPEEYIRWLFSALALSDALDGFLARLLKAQSQLGKILDPLADKVMMLSALLVCVYKLEVIPPYLLYTLLLRDVSILVGSAYIIRTKGKVPDPSPLGKATTFMLSLTVALFLFGYRVDALVFVSTVLILSSWMDYAVRAHRELYLRSNFL